MTSHDYHTIVLYVCGHVIVNDVLNVSEVQAFGRNVSSHQDILLRPTKLPNGPLALLLVCGASKPHPLQNKKEWERGNLSYTFASMNADSLNAFQQQILVNIIHFSLLL